MFKMRLFQLTFCVVFAFVNCGKHFRLGRGRGGNLGAPGGDGVQPLPAAQWFKQKLDHFTPSDTREWKQRFYVNDSFYDFNSAGPVFLMIGGEGPADPRWMVNGTWIDFAKQFKALCINLEHRYYGESHPTSDMSTKNLKHLTSEQALADLAYFITSMNKKMKLLREVKWVVFGGSYPGSLAAWMRLKYPHLVYAAVSSSAPLLAKADFAEYFQVVISALREKTQSDDCALQIQQAHVEIVELMKTNKAVIEEEFKVCKPFDNATENDIKNFYNSIANDFADLVQYNEDNRISADNKTNNLTINSVCAELTRDSGPAHARLAEFHAQALQRAGDKCLDYSYNNMIQELRNISWGQDGARQWMYQTCNEFGFYQTSSGEPEMFGNDFTLDFFIQQCQDIFGKRFDLEQVSRGVEWTNAMYGALESGAERVVAVQGSVDPWHALGARGPGRPGAPALLVRGTAHCADMYPPRAADPPALRSARSQLRRILRQWIAPHSS